MRRRKQLIRRVGIGPAVLLALALAPGPALAQSGGDQSAAVAINTKDGSSVLKLAFDIRRVMNGIVDQQNVAVAYANCESCQTVAISFQLVLVMSDPSVVTPENLAIAINESCSLCSTYAGAFQFVFGNGGRVRFTAEGSKEIAQIRRELQSLRKGDLTTAEIQTRAEELAVRTRQVLATQVVPVGKPGSGDDAVGDGRPPVDDRAGDDDQPSTTTTPGDPTTTTTPTETMPTAPTTTSPPATTTTTPKHHDAAMRPLAAALALLLCPLLAACGDDEPAQVLSDTAEKLAGVKSGELSLRFVATPKGKDADGQIGFELEGPFSVAKPGALPVAELDYTQIAGPRRGEAKLLSTGREAFVEVDGKVYELPPERERQLRGAKGELKREGGLGMLDIGAWIRRPKLSEGETVDGVETDRVTSELDVVAALNDLAALSRGAGAGAGRKLEGESAKQVERAVRSSRLELLTGKDDRLLRRLAIDVDFGLEVPEALRSVVGPVAGGRVQFELGIDRPNRDVTVAEPADARPYPGA